MLMKAQFIQKQSEELEQNLQIVDKELEDLQDMHSSLDFLNKSKETSTISTIGKGIHVKTNLESKELLVEVGAGVVVKKTPEEAKKIIAQQIKKLSEARGHLSGKLEIYQRTLASIVNEIEQEQNKNEDIEQEHEHDEHCNHNHAHEHKH